MEDRVAKQTAQPLLAVGAIMKSEGVDGRSQGSRTTADSSMVSKPSCPEWKANAAVVVPSVDFILINWRAGSLADAEHLKSHWHGLS
jgi:hypothetical protein